MSVLQSRRSAVGFRSAVPPSYQRVEYLYRSAQYAGPYADIHEIVIPAGTVVATKVKLVSNPDAKEMAFGFCSHDDYAIETYYQASTVALSLWSRPSGFTSNATITTGDVDEISFSTTVACSFKWIGVYRPGSYSPDVRLYRVTMTNSGTVIHDFLPCRRNADGELGFYDAPTGIFYTNAADSGSWVAGPNIYE